MSRAIASLRRRAGLLAALAVLALAGCGGGGGGGDTATPSVTILDSFGNVVAAGGADGVGPGDSGGDGTAGDGVPIVGGTVTVTDAAGKSVSAVTNAQGYYRVKLTGMTPPFVLKVTRANGTSFWHSLSVTSPKTNAFINMNISGLTEKVASDVARAGGKSGAADLTPQIVSSNTAAISQSVAGMRTTLQPVISASGVAVANFDPLGTPFRPDGTGIDFVLDNTVVVIAADGSAQVSVSPNFTPPLTGTWRMFITAEGQTIDTQTDVPGSAVPTAQVFSSYSANQFGTFLAPVAGVNYTVTVNGNTTTITGPNTNYTIVINSFSASNYQGCGACGVGSQVSFTMVINATTGGTIDGTSDPTTTQNLSATLMWKRTS